MDAFFTSSGLIALVTLTFLEIVLGVDNVIFISILSSKLPASQQGRARRLGFLAANGLLRDGLLGVLWRPSTCVSGGSLCLFTGTSRTFEVDWR